MERSVTQTLEEEHRLIQQVVGSMAVMADKVNEEQVAERETLINLVEFMQGFVGKCHHQKEDNHLFPLLVKKGVPVAGCPIGALTHEHQTSAKLTADFSAAVEAYLKNPAETGHNLVTTLRDIVALLPGHIWKENFLLFPMTDKILNEKEQQELAEKFELEEKTIGVDVHHRFEQLAATLAENAQRA